MASERDKDRWIARYDRGNEPTGRGLSMRRPRASAVIEGRAVLRWVKDWVVGGCFAGGLHRERSEPGQGW